MTSEFLRPILEVAELRVQWGCFLPHVLFAGTAKAFMQVNYKMLGNYMYCPYLTTKIFNACISNSTRVTIAFLAEAQAQG